MGSLLFQDLFLDRAEVSIEEGPCIISIQSVYGLRPPSIKDEVDFDYLISWAGILSELEYFPSPVGRMKWTSLKEVASQFFVSGHVLPRISRSLYSLVPHDPDPRL